MKAVKFLVIMVGMTTLCSCGKDKPVAPSDLVIDTCTGEVTLRGGGDEDDDPIIQGDIADGESNPVPNASIELFKDGDTTASQTTTSDSNGDFSFQTPTGDYFIKATPTGLPTVTTSVFNVPQSGHTITIVI